MQVAKELRHVRCSRAAVSLDDGGGFGGQLFVLDVSPHPVHVQVANDLWLVGCSRAAVSLEDDGGFGGHRVVLNVDPHPVHVQVDNEIRHVGCPRAAVSLDIDGGDGCQCCRCLRLLVLSDGRDHNKWDQQIAS